MYLLRLFLVIGLMTCPLLGLFPGPARAQALFDLPDDPLEVYANEALATFGLVAVPNETASAFAIENTQGDFNNFASAQIGGGGVPKWADYPIYLESYVGLQRYDPEFLINREEAEDITLRATWTGIAGTFGAGWSVDLGRNWSLTPIANLSLGHISSSASAQAGGSIIDLDPGSLFSGGLTAGGIGASLLATYDYDGPEAEYDIRLRHTHLELYSIGSSSDLSARATAVTTSAWARARFPIEGARAFRRPVKSLWEASISAYPGDQAALLDIDWLGRIGSGIELDLTQSGLPLTKHARISLQYVFGDDYRGVSFGFGIGLGR